MAFEVAGRISVRFIRLSVGLGVGGLFLYETAGHAFPEAICKRALGPGGDEVPAKCIQIYEEMAAKMHLEHPERVSFFVNRGFSGFHAGATKLPNGAVIGIPGWYLFETAEDVMNSPINFKERTIKWESEMGQQIRDSLIPTKENIAFTIGHEIGHLQMPEYKILRAIMSPAWLYLTYKVAVSTTRFAPALSMLLDIALKLCILRLSYLGYRYVKREVNHHEEFNADKMSASTTVAAAQGGVDYIRKRLQLNSVLRALHGSSGESYYDQYGNELKARSHPKLTERLHRLESIVSEHMKQQGIIKSAGSEESIQI
ncbi:transmembrane protein 177 [Nematostella vectensis]|uniref:transmembrane protein 177 n=1 Tax=Nematostella vectensis TaxID=45351 RepID=UPI002076FB7E|nr:transmembrane protein 177 [Nematostella vectensis]